MNKALVKQLEKDFNYLVDNYDEIIENKQFAMMDIIKHRLHNPIVFTDEYIFKALTSSYHPYKYLDEQLNPILALYVLNNLNFFMLDDIEIYPKMEECIICIIELALQKDLTFKRIKELYPDHYYPKSWAKYETSLTLHYYRIDPTILMLKLIEHNNCSNQSLHKIEKFISHPGHSAHEMTQEIMIKKLKKHQNYNIAENILDRIQAINEK